MAGDPYALRQRIAKAFDGTSGCQEISKIQEHLSAAPATETDVKGVPFSLQQLWAIVILCKYVRLRARSNAAFNNLFNVLFPYAKFQQVTKKRISRRTGQEESYPGLQITINGETLDIDDDDEQS